MAWEFAVLDFLQQIRTEIGDVFFSAITHLGDGGIVWIMLSLMFLCIKPYRKYGVAMSLALIFGLLIGNMTLKPLIARIRPYDINTAIELLIKEPSDFSFPSGHTLASFNAALALFYCNRKFGIFAIVLAVFIAFSRMYLYVHYPTDILGGILLAVLCSFAAYRITLYLCEKDINGKFFQLERKPADD